MKLTNATFTTVGKPKVEGTFPRLIREKIIPVSYFKSGISIDKKNTKPFTGNLTSQVDGYEINIYFK